MSFSLIMLVMCLSCLEPSLLPLLTILLQMGPLLLPSFVLLAEVQSSLWENGMDLFRKLKQELHESIMTCSSNTFFIPRTKSIFSWISDTKVKISNLSMYVYNYWNHK